MPIKHYTQKPPRFPVVRWGDSDCEACVLEVTGRECRTRPHPENPEVMQVETPMGWAEVANGDALVLREGAIEVVKAVEFDATNTEVTQ